jgi:hypothetical protein
LCWLLIFFCGTGAWIHHSTSSFSWAGFSR